MPKYEVRDSVDVFHVQRAVSAFALIVGFSRRECGELAIVASELTSNILKYAVKGSVELESFSDGSGTGVTLIAADRGPPFHDLALAMRDGWDDRGPIDPLQMLKRKGIGGGLGAVLRLSHEFRVDTEPNGKRVHVVRYLGRRLPGGIR
jgi:anti-sigma regulatory factor (Ser/Thr protein kinase)